MVELFKVWNLPSFILLVGIAEFIIALWSGEYLRKNIKIDESEIKLSRIKVK